VIRAAGPGRSYQPTVLNVGTGTDGSRNGFNRYPSGLRNLPQEMVKTVA
jgi:hypothetical protein